MNNLRIQELPAEFTIKNFIKKIGKYGYEDYILDFVNNSPFFAMKSNGELYYHPEKEDHGQCDCQSGAYSIDFKLLSSNALLQAQSLFSPQIACTDGLILESPARKTPKDSDYKPIVATRIYVALRGLDLHELMDIKTSPSTDPADNDIRHLLTIMEVKKNILAFFPYNLFFDETITFDAGLEIILKALTNDFQNLMFYRLITCPDKDIFFCFLYKEHMILAQWNAKCFQFIEKLPISKSTLFMKILGIADDQFRWFGLK